MGQLTLDKIFEVCMELKRKGEDLSQYQVYLGDDDELNGIHTGWYVNVLSTEKDDEDFIGLINEDRHNEEFRGKGILIS